MPKAYVMLAASAVPDRATALSIFRLTAERLAPYKRIRHIEFVDALPKTISGKIRRVELRRREQELADGSASRNVGAPVFDTASFTADELQG